MLPYWSPAREKKEHKKTPKQTAKFQFAGIDIFLSRESFD